MQIVDGAKFWNPYEGLGVAADLLKLTRSWLESGTLKDATRPKQDAIRATQELETRTRSIRPLVKASVQAWHDVRLGKRDEAYPIRLSNADVQTVLAVREQIKQLQRTIEDSNGTMQLRDLAIEYPGCEVRFTVAHYFDFVFRSLDEIANMSKDGKITGPSPDQVF